MKIIASIITSGLITSAFLFLFQQSISAKLKHLELQFGSVIQYRQKNLDLVIKAYEDVWSGLVEIERLLLRQKMLLFPDDLYENTERALKCIDESFNKFLATIHKYKKSC